MAWAVAVLAPALAAAGSVAVVVRGPAQLAVGSVDDASVPGPRQATASQVKAKEVPLAVELPSIGVSASMVRLGLDDSSGLEAPWEFGVTGWWSGGSLPGDPGPARWWSATWTPTPGPPCSPACAGWPPAILSGCRSATAGW